MRRMIGAILIEIRPDRKIVSAWRGVARAASKPKRAMSRRGPMCDIHSIAQQARPNESGKLALPTAQRPAFSSVVVSTPCSTCFSSSSPSSSPRSMSRARSWRARNSALGPDPSWLAGHLHSSAPLRHTYT